MIQFLFYTGTIHNNKYTHPQIQLWYPASENILHTGNFNILNTSLLPVTHFLLLPFTTQSALVSSSWLSQPLCTLQRILFAYPWGQHFPPPILVSLHATTLPCAKACHGTV